MKNSKKILILVLSLVLIASLAVLAICLGTCGNQGDSSGDPAKDSNYTVTVTTASGAPVSGVKVSVYNENANENAIKEANTNASGKVYFNLTEAVYDVRVSSLPLGYNEVAGKYHVYKTQAVGSELKIQLIASVIEEEMPANTVYSVGSVMYDFSLTLSDDTEWNLKDALTEKKAVLINFWATWCGPCASEFPYLNEAAQMYADEVAVLALSTYDDNSAVAGYKSQNGLKFDMAADALGLSARFGVSNIPVNIVIDRFGIVAYTHVGAYETTSQFTALFEKYISDDYASIGPVDPNKPDDTEKPREKPDVSMPESSKIEAAINGSGYNFGYVDYSEEDEYSWPWLVMEDGKSIGASNVGKDNSYAIIRSTFHAEKGGVLAFEYKASCESGDILYVQIDGVIMFRIAGISDGWQNLFAMVAPREGDYTLDLIYLKDEADALGEDNVYIRNMRLVTVDDIDEPIDIIRYCADVENPDGSDTKYAEYITPVFNDHDGYYHVNSEDGPYLLADMNNGTHWSVYYSLYDYAINGYCYFDGLDYQNSFIEYCSLAAYSPVGFCPVNEELYILLNMFTDANGMGYENEWLEFCVYFEHYGPGEEMENPIAGITYFSALRVHEGINEINIKSFVMPRGYKYLFTAEQAGVYNFQAISEDETEGWLFSEDKTQLCECDSYIEFVEKEDLSGKRLVGNLCDNFRMTMYLEEGQTIYVVCAFKDSSLLGTYQLEIEYLGESYTRFENAALGPFTYTLDTYELYTIGAIKYVLGSDNYYHELKKDGTVGSIIYVDFLNPTRFFSESLKTMLSYTTTKPFDCTANGGEDYTDRLRTYLTRAERQPGLLKGFYPVDKNLIEYLTKITQKHVFESLTDAWLLLCYYDKYYGKEEGGTVRTVSPMEENNQSQPLNVLAEEYVILPKKED